MADTGKHRSGSSSPSHIVIPSIHSPPSVLKLHSSRTGCSLLAEEDLHMHDDDAAATASCTTTGLPSSSSRVPTLMPAMNHTSQHPFRPDLSYQTKSPKSPSSISTMSSTFLPQPAQAQAQQVQPATNGPVSRAIVIPARAKPGRKAMDNSEKEDRRRKQNRNAQRNYRDRRSQQVAELSDEVTELKQQHREAYNQHVQEMQRLHNEHQQLKIEWQKSQDEIQRWIEKANHFEHAYTQIASALPREIREQMRGSLLPPTQQDHSNVVSDSLEFSITKSNDLKRAQAPLPDFSTVSLPPLIAKEEVVEEAMPPTPPEDTPDETDFTQIWLQNRAVQSSQPQIDPANGDDLTMSCGFCSDSDYCPCKEAASQLPSLLPVQSTIETKPTTTGPGTCDMCQRDPARAEACRSLAEQTRPSRTPPAAAQTDKTMNCGQFIDRANNNLGRMPSIAEILGPLHSYPAAKGFDVNEQEAAVVLQRMATQPSP